MNNFEKKLSERLDHPSVDSETGAILEAGYEAAQQKQLIPDNLYQIYIKYHGKLNALPREELITRELINPNTGQLFPLSSWPTKQSRKVASAKWAAYNQRLQQADPEDIETNPCADIETYIQQIMQDCMATSRDPNKCTKQVEKLRIALQKHCE